MCRSVSPGPHCIGFSSSAGSGIQRLRQDKIRSRRMQAYNVTRKRARENENELCGRLKAECPLPAEDREYYTVRSGGSRSTHPHNSLNDYKDEVKD